MAGNRHVIDELAVIITGDNSGLSKSLTDSAKDVEKATSRIVGDLHKIEKAQQELRPNAALDGIFGLTPKGGGGSPVVNAQKQTEAFFAAVQDQKYRAAQTTNFLSAVEEKAAREKIDLEKRMMEAVKLHEREVARAKAEGLSRDKERLQVEKQLARERQQILKQETQDRKMALNSLMGMRGGGGGSSSRPDITGAVDFERPKESGLGFQDVLKGIGVLYAANRIAAMAMVDAQEDLNKSHERGAYLQQQMAEEASFQQSEADQKAASLPIKERIEFLNEELKKHQQLAESQRKIAEAAAAEIEKNRSPGLGKGGERSKYLPGQALESIAGSFVRTTDLGGKGTEYEEGKKRVTELEAIARKSAEAVKKYQRELGDLEVGGDNAEQAFNRFKTRMNEQIDIVGKSHKAIMLARLTHEQNLSESQKREAEALYDALEAKKEAYQKAGEVTDAYFAAEIRAIDAGAAKEKQIFRADPVRRYREEIDELVGMFEEGYIGAEAFGMGIDQIEKRLNGEGDGSRGGGLHKVAAALAGSADAISRASDYSFQLRGSPGQTGSPELKALQDIRNELRTLNKKPQAIAKPVNS